MKVLFVGDLSSYARSRQRFLAMKKLGYVVEGLPSVLSEAEGIVNCRPSLWSRVCYKLGYPIDTVGINKNLIPAITEHQPDILWIEKTNTILPFTYRAVSFS